MHRYGESYLKLTFSLSFRIPTISMDMNIEDALAARRCDGYKLLSCQPRMTVTSCFVYKIIRDLESIDHLCINTQVIYQFALAQVEC